MAISELKRSLAVDPEHSSLRKKEEEFSSEELLWRHRKSLGIILNVQHPSGLFPAAVSPHVDNRARMGDAWIRDGAIVAGSLLNPYSRFVAENDPAQREIVRLGGEAAEKWLHIQHSLFGNETERFKQRIEVARDEAGKNFRRITKPAPSIHSETNGKAYAWPEPNQPDSFGFHLIALAEAWKQGMKLSADEQRIVEREVDFLLRADLPHLQQTSMWEWGKVYDPSPISSVAIDTHGLKRILPFMPDEIQNRIRRAVHKGERYVKEKFPVEFTCPEGHPGKTDLATLVAIGHGAMDYVDQGEYFAKARGELDADGGPGAIRYRGDHYYREENHPKREARWLIWNLYRAGTAMNAGIKEANRNNFPLARDLLSEGQKSLRRATDVFDKHGYAMELLYYDSEGKLVPNVNHLLWNEALIARAASSSLYLSSRLSGANFN